MEKPSPCTICQGTDHHPRKCPELHKDLETGFYKPAGGMPQGGDDDDEKARVNQQTHNCLPQQGALQVRATFPLRPVYDRLTYLQSPCPTC